MKIHRKIKEIFALFGEITDEARIKEMLKDTFCANIMDSLGTDSRTIIPVMQYYTGKMLIREENRGGKIFIITNKEVYDAMKHNMSD